MYQKGEIYIFAVVFVTAELSDHYCVFAVVEGDVAEVEQEGGVFQHFGAEEVAEEDIFAGGWFVDDRVGAVGHSFSGVRFDPGGDDWWVDNRLLFSFEGLEYEFPQFLPVDLDILAYFNDTPVSNDLRIIKLAVLSISKFILEHRINGFHIMFGS